ncbi:ATP-binding cassette domain-containing protein [Mycoplasma sp. Ms02]|uniref:ATP-binding cassette domain-containing protein n=1 Tax=Mycoplasma sp. Ms02 TaxID=353851 RepID=UPI001C8A6935|nr:ATP-binding cassette domain-containing protein [Mycoplasma sp. Ms02]QZE12123.1 ATP-binding cassette domain-containing protein [Mycoplasma sp. Ms02]
MKIQSNNQVVQSNGLPKYILELHEELKKAYHEELAKVDMSEIVLQIEDMDKVYENGFQAVFGTSLYLKKGEFLSLLGPSGCGKTTTLRAIAGLDLPTSGNVRINGTDVTYAEPSDRDITMVFQNYALFPHLSVRDNIAFGLRSNKSKIGEEGHFYKIEKLLKNKVRYLSSTIKDIENVSKIQKSIEKLELKVQKMDQKYKQKNEHESSLSVQAKNKLRLMFFKLNGLKVLLEAQKSKLVEIKDLTPAYKKLVSERQKLLDELKQNVLNKKAARTKDDKKAIINNKIKEASSILGLDYYLDRKPSALSGGQRQRVALGRSIVGNPSLFLMDEPLSNLDAKLRASMRSEIRRIHEKVGAGTVYVTHDQIEAMTMSDKIAIMSDGFVQQIGTPSDVYKNPANLFVAQFIGTPTMNLYEGTYKQGKFVSESFTLDLLPHHTKNIEENQKVVLGIRPQDISVDEMIKNTYSNSINVKITAKELLGNEIQYTGLIENSNKELIFITNSYENYSIGDSKQVHLISSRFHIFDQKTTISLTSEFNYETLNSLVNWSNSNEKIKIRRELLDFTKNKNTDMTITKYTVQKVKSLFAKKK